VRPRASECRARRPVRAVQAQAPRPGARRSREEAALVLVAALLGPAALAQQEIMTTFQLRFGHSGTAAKGIEFDTARVSGEVVVQA